MCQRPVNWPTPLGCVPLSDIPAPCGTSVSERAAWTGSSGCSHAQGGRGCRARSGASRTGAAQAQLGKCHAQQAGAHREAADQGVGCTDSAAGVVFLLGQGLPPGQCVARHFHCVRCRDVCSHVLWPVQRLRKARTVMYGMAGPMTLPLCPYYASHSVFCHDQGDSSNSMHVV